MIAAQPTQQTARAISVALVAPEAYDWDAFVQTHPQGNLLQLSGWGELKSAFGWETRRIALEGPTGLRAGAQILIKRRFGLAGMYVPRGPLFSGDAEVDRLLLTALDRLARRNRAIFMRLEPNILADDSSADQLHTQLLLANYQPTDTLQPRSSVHLDLAPALDRLQAAMSKGHRADIRRAARDGVVVREGSNEADFDAFYAIMESTAARAEFGIHSREYYHTAWRIFGANGASVLLLAEWQGQTVATAMMFADSHAGLYLYSGSNEAGLKSGAQHAIQWQALQWAKQHGCSFYDFWGIPDAFGQAAQLPEGQERETLEAAAKADPLYGVYRFKKGFGGHVVRYMPAYDRVYVPALYRLWQRRLG